MSVYVENNNPSGIVYDNKTTSQMDGEGPGEHINSGSSVLSTLYEITPETQWVDWNPSTNEFGKVSSVGVGAGCLVIGNPDDVTSGQAWITNYDGTWWDRVVPSLYTGQSGKFGTHIELAKNKIFIGQPESNHNSYTNAGSIEILDYRGNYVRSVTNIPTYRRNDTYLGAKGSFAIGDNIVFAGSPATKLYNAGDPVDGLVVERFNPDIGGVYATSLSAPYINLTDWWTDQIGNTFQDPQTSSFGQSVAYGSGRFFIGDELMTYYVANQGLFNEDWKVTGGLAAWSPDGYWMRNYYYPGPELSGDGYPENAGRIIRVGSGYVGTTLNGTSGAQWHQPVLRPGGIIYWEIETGKLFGPLKMPNPLSNGGAFGTEGPTRRSGDFDIGCGFIVGTANAAHSTNGTASVVIWELGSQSLVEQFNIHPTKNNQEHFVEQVKIADGYVFISGEIDGQGGFVYRYRLPQTVGSTVESLLSTYINNDERVQ